MRAALTRGQPGASPETIEAVARKVRAFYEDFSFPGYEDYDDVHWLVEKGREGIYTRMLDEQIPHSTRLLDAGCGTGQLAVFLSLNSRKAIGIDFSMGSLRKGQEFKTRFNLKNVSLLQMDVFALGFAEESFDYVFCNGVLHHTADAYRGFQNLCGVVKRGGYLIIGLYNSYGRVLLNLRRLLFRLSAERLAWLDYYVRARRLGEEKARIWYMDQYRNPFERTFSVGEVLRWFRENGVEYINSVPKIRLGERLTPEDWLFEPHEPGHSLEHVLCQIGWLFTKGREGGFFLTIGRRKGERRKA